MAKRKSRVDKYLAKIELEKDKLKCFANDEELNADMLLYRYKLDGRDVPDDIYRACAFFINGEYNTKSGILPVLYQTRESLRSNLPKVIKENAIDQLCYRLQVYNRLIENIENGGKENV
jgi:hypothetical protein